MSRKSLVPFVLPADPTQALEAATKRYVDSRAALGIVAVGALSGVSPVAASANTKITTPIAYTTAVGRRYRLVLKVRAIYPVGTAGFFRTVVFDNNVDQFTVHGDSYTLIDSPYSTHYAEHVFDGDGLAHSFEMVAAPNVSFHVFFNLAFFYLEDVGLKVAPA